MMDKKITFSKSIKGFMIETNCSSVIAGFEDFLLLFLSLLSLFFFAFSIVAASYCALCLPLSVLDYSENESSTDDSAGVFAIIFFPFSYEIFGRIIFYIFIFTIVIFKKYFF